MKECGLKIRSTGRGLRIFPKRLVFSKENIITVKNRLVSSYFLMEISMKVSTIKKQVILLFNKLY